MTALETLNVPHVAKLRVRDFLLLHESGAFADYAKSELIEGNILVMNAAFSSHGKVQAELAFQLRLALQAGGLNARIYTATSVELSDDSLPEPDIVVAADHAGGPLPHNKVLLLVEVADSTLKGDLGRKAGLYARTGIAEYWVADIEGRRIVRLWEPGERGYARRADTPFGETVESITLAVSVETAAL